MNARGLMFASFATALVGVQSAHASESDFQLENGGWNGCSAAIGTARALGIEVSTPRALDWQTVGPNDTIVLIAPQTALPVDGLDAFVRIGGRLIVADDFGTAGPLFRRWGIRREAIANDDTVQALGSEPGKVRFGSLGDAPALLVATATDNSPLLAGANEKLITNRPAKLRAWKQSPTERGQPATSLYDLLPGYSVALHGARGRGEFLALSDPSMLINLMMDARGNSKFWTRIVQSIGPADADGRLIVLVGRIGFVGVPPVHLGQRPAALEKAALTLAAFNLFLAEISDYLATFAILRVIVMLGVLALLMTLMQGALGIPWSAGLRPNASFAIARHGRSKRSPKESSAVSVDAIHALSRSYERGLRPIVGQIDIWALPTRELELRLARVLGESAKTAAKLRDRLIKVSRSTPGADVDGTVSLETFTQILAAWDALSPHLEQPTSEQFSGPSRMR